MPVPPHTVRNLNPDWRDEAACSRAIAEDPSLKNAWIKEIEPYEEYEELSDEIKLDIDNMDRAKKICQTCSVRLECAINAVNDDLAQGIRAGAEFDVGLLLTADARMLAKELGVAGQTRRRYTNLGPTIYGRKTL